MADYKPSNTPEIKIWDFQKAPKALRERVDAKSEWLVLIPPSLVSSGIERLFWRWHDHDHPVTELVLPDGSVVLAGSHPSTSTMTIEVALLTSGARETKQITREPGL